MNKNSRFANNPNPIYLNYGSVQIAYLSTFGLFMNDRSLNLKSGYLLCDKIYFLFLSSFFKCRKSYANANAIPQTRSPVVFA